MSTMNGKEAERVRQIEEKEKEIHDLGQKVKILFWILIANGALAILAAIFQLSKDTSTVNTLQIFGQAVNIIFGIVICTLPRPESRFGKAGVCQIIASIAGVFEYALGSSDIAVVCTLVALVFGLIYVYSFIPEMAERVDPYDPYLSESWRGFLKLYTICLIMPFLLVILVLFRLGGATLIYLLSLAYPILIIVMIVWQMILFKKTSDTCIAYKAPEKSTIITSVRNNSGRTSPKAFPSKDEWKCSCGNINPNFLGMCSCGVRKREAKEILAQRSEKLMANRAAHQEQANEADEGSEPKE